MQNPDLSQPNQIFLIAVMVVTLVGILTRAAMFVRCEWAGLELIYPRVWNKAQRRTLETFRLLIGFALVGLWVAFVILSPSMPTNWPFGYLEAVSQIILHLMTYAWILLLLPLNWKTFGALSNSFWMTITVLVVSWGAMLLATGWMLVKATESAPRLDMPPVGVFAQRAAHDLWQSFSLGAPGSYAPLAA
jgi:hypothetical protein